MCVEIIENAITDVYALEREFKLTKKSAQERKLKDL